MLEGKLDPAEEGFAARGLAGGRHDAECNITAACQLDRVGDIRCHDVIRIAIAQFRFETREELLLAAIPGDDDFHACQLSAVGIQDQHL